MTEMPDLRSGDRRRHLPGSRRAASLALMKAGFTVVLAGRRVDMLKETQKLGDNVGKSLPVSADMTDPGSIGNPVCQGDGGLWPARPAVQQRRHAGAPAVPFEDPEPGAVAGRREHQPDPGRCRARSTPSAS